MHLTCIHGYIIILYMQPSLFQLGICTIFPLGFDQWSTNPSAGCIERQRGCGDLKILKKIGLVQQEIRYKYKIYYMSLWLFNTWDISTEKWMKLQLSVSNVVTNSNHDRWGKEINAVDLDIWFFFPFSWELCASITQTFKQTTILLFLVSCTLIDFIFDLKITIDPVNFRIFKNLTRIHN